MPDSMPSFVTLQLPFHTYIYIRTQADPVTAGGSGTHHGERRGASGGRCFVGLGRNLGGGAGLVSAGREAKVRSGGRRPGTGRVIEEVIGRVK